MFETSQYELIDFGHGRKIERFGELVLERPSPAADSFTPQEEWPQADWRYDRQSNNDGRWSSPAGESEAKPWTIQHAGWQMELRLTDFGHLGVFPEQAANWDWIARRVARAKRQLKVLNLFAYTGGSTLAAVSAGAQVVHVDSASNVMGWARHNAERSGLQDASIRWICEDAMTFVEREVRRGNKYDAVILDPPSFGHGPKNEVWKLTQHLPKLLRYCAKLVESQLAFLLFSCHTSGYGPAEMQASLEDTFFGHCQTGAWAGQLFVQTADGRRLPSGVVAKWPA